jgi:hypothetical protein
VPVQLMVAVHTDLGDGVRPGPAQERPESSTRRGGHPRG